MFKLNQRTLRERAHTGNTHMSVLLLCFLYLFVEFMITMNGWVLFKPTCSRPLEAERLKETTASRLASVATVEAYWSVNQRVIRNLSTFSSQQRSRCLPGGCDYTGSWIFNPLNSPCRLRWYGRRCCCCCCWGCRCTSPVCFHAKCVSFVSVLHLKPCLAGR